MISLSDRMLKNYENVTRFYLPRRSYFVLRLDQRAGHTYTRHLQKPYDKDYSRDINKAAIELCKQVQGFNVCFCQSDEVSILFTDFQELTSEPWFGGNIQKISSVSASIMAAEFNKLRFQRVYEKERNQKILLNKDDADFIKLNFDDFKLAGFDARVFSISETTEVYNYFLSRNIDCYRNAVSATAQSMFPHKDLQGKNCDEMIQMIQDTGIYWKTFNPAFKFGRIITRKPFLDMGMPQVQDWTVTDGWDFNAAREELMALIPKYP